MRQAHPRRGELPHGAALPGQRALESGSRKDNRVFAFLTTSADRSGKHFATAKRTAGALCAFLPVNHKEAWSMPAWALQASCS